MRAVRNLNKVNTHKQKATKEATPSQELQARRTTTNKQQEASFSISTGELLHAANTLYKTMYAFDEARAS